MKISDRGIEFIKTWEGCKLSSYQDVAGIWTVGYGRAKSIYPGMRITQRQADEFLAQDLLEVKREIEHLVKVPLNQGQVDALHSFIFNCGAGAFAKSTLLKLLNKGDYTGAANEFIKWCHADGKIIEGLLRRRKAEKNTFLGLPN